jgi:hypothetical protein
MTAQAQVNPATLQAVFLYQSIKHLEWPSDQLENFEIVVVGESELYEELQKVAKSRKIGTRAITVRRVDNVSKIPECHIVVAPQFNQSILTHIAQRPIVLVTTTDGLLEKGSDLNFIKKGDKLSFQLNNTNLQAKKIKVSSAFVSMADKTI